MLKWLTIFMLTVVPFFVGLGLALYMLEEELKEGPTTLQNQVLQVFKTRGETPKQLHNNLMQNYPSGIMRRKEFAKEMSFRVEVMNAVLQAMYTSKYEGTPESLPVRDWVAVYAIMSSTDQFRRVLPLLFDLYSKEGKMDKEGANTAVNFLVRCGKVPYRTLVTVNNAWPLQKNYVANGTDLVKVAWNSPALQYYKKEEQAINKDEFNRMVDYILQLDL